MTLHHVGAPRPRFNEKGRRASAAHEKSKKRTYEVDDSNADIIDPEQRKKQKQEVSHSIQHRLLRVVIPLRQWESNEAGDGGREASEEVRQLTLASLRPSRMQQLERQRCRLLPRCRARRRSD